MICDISNAYPSNIAVDAAHNVRFSFVFYGDGCKGADFILYDSTITTAAPVMIPTRLYDNRRIYFNGEEIDANSGGISLNGKFVNGRSYIWKVRMYDDVSIGAGKYPSVLRFSGDVAKPPYIFGKIQLYTADMKETEIPIEKNLDITLPMWMRIGSDETYRIVTSYDETTGICVLKNTFDVKPEEGADYSLCSIKSYVPTQEFEDNQLFLERGITEFNGAEFEASGKSYTGYCWYIEMDGIYVAITGYDPKTGILTLEDATFSTKEPGDKYNIWTAFIDSRFYAITTKETPAFSSAIGYADGENLLFEAELSGTHQVSYYWLDIYEDNVLIETTKQIHMAKLSYYYKKAKANKEYHAVFHVATQDGMVNQEDSSWWKSSMTATNVTNKCESLTISETKVGGIAASLDKEKHAVKLQLLGTSLAEGTLIGGNNSDLSTFNIGADLDITISSGSYITLAGTIALPVKSYTKSTGVLVTSSPSTKYFPPGTEFNICEKLSSSGLKYRVLRTSGTETTLIGNFKSTTIYDYTCASNTQYQYIVQPYETVEQDTEGHQWISHFFAEASCSLTTPMGKAWAIYGLIPVPYTSITNDDTRIFYPYQDEFSDYSISDIWLAALDIDPTHSVTQNLNKVVYTGDHPKPVAVAGQSDYDTFALSFTVGGVNCPGNKIAFGTIKDILQWKNFVAKSGLVMLKDPDGSVWVGAITSSSYDKIHYGTRTEYKVTFEFTELKDASTVLIQN